MWDWENGAAVKCTCCSCRGSEVQFSLSSHSSSQLSERLISGIQRPLPASVGIACMWCTDITHRQNTKVKINPKKSYSAVTCWLLTCRICHNHSSQAKEKDPTFKQNPLEQTLMSQNKPLFPPLQTSFFFESIETSPSNSSFQNWRSWEKTLGFCESKMTGCFPTRLRLRAREKTTSPRLPRGRAARREVPPEIPGASLVRG